MTTDVARRTTPAPTTTMTTPSARSQVTVRRDDTLTDIAARHQTTVEAMRQANPQLKNIDLLQPGQVQALPVRPSSSPVPASVSSESVAPAAPASTATQTACRPLSWW